MNLKEARKQLKKKVNFKKLSKSKQRVLIAKDAIAELKLRKITASHAYATVRFKKAFSKKELNGPMMHKEIEVKDAPRQSCYVCALGSMFIADVDRRNKLSVSVSNKDDWYGNPAQFFDFNRSDMIKRLGKLFSVEQLDLIECAYERNVMTGSFPEGLDDAITFGGAFNEDSDRMIAIMQNIVDNKGKFVPPSGEELAALHEDSDDDEGGSMESASSSSASADGVCADEGDLGDCESDDEEEVFGL